MRSVGGFPEQLHSRFPFMKAIIQIQLSSPLSVQNSLKHFNSRFPTEEACSQAWFEARWPHGFCCPRCSGDRSYPISTRRLLQCSQCGYQASLTAGTLLENTRTSLRKWLLTFYLISQSSGINATELHRIIKVTYKTAWAMLSKIRYAISQSIASVPLSGKVRISSAVYGFKPHTSLLLIPGESPVVIGASIDSRDNPRCIRIMLKLQLQHHNQFGFRPNDIERFQQRHVDPRSTDVQSIYKPIHWVRFKPLKSLIKKAASYIHTTYGSIGRKHLQAYLDEYCFRYNSAVKYASSFNQILQDSIIRTRIPYEQIVNGAY